MAGIKEPARRKIKAYLKAQRKLGNRMSYNILAEICGVTGATFGQWMSKRPPKRDQIAPIMEMVGITFVDIYGSD